MIEEYLLGALKGTHPTPDALEVARRSLLSVNRTVISRLVGEATVFGFSQQLRSPREQHNAKVAENASFVHQLKRQKKAREERETGRKQEFLNSLRAYDEALSTRQQELAALKQREMNIKLQGMRESSLKRREESSALKRQGNEHYKQVASSTPLYKRMEENYNLQVVLPELEKKKTELAKKRMLYQPMSLEELKEHAYRHDLALAQANNSHRHSNSQEGKLFLSTLHESRYRKILVQEERERKTFEAAEKNKRRELADRRTRYSQLVKEMHPPTVDLAKGLQAAKKQQKYPQNTRFTSSFSETGRASIAKHKWKKNSMLPQPPEKRESIVVDYLAERRVLCKESPVKDSDPEGERLVNSIRAKVARLPEF